MKPASTDATGEWKFPIDPLWSWPTVEENVAAASSPNVARRGGDYGHGKGKGKHGKGKGKGHGHGKCKPKPEKPVNTTGFRYYKDCTKDALTTSLPDIDYNFGEMYSSNIAINPSKPNDTLFYVFKPKDGAPVDELTIWLTGGPGCSSLFGFMREIGPIMWAEGQIKARENPYAWSKLTNVLFVDQPVGTGFSTGTPTAKSSADVAVQFADWFKEFQKKFGIKNYKIFVTGESYGGRWVPYISAEFLNRADKSTYDLKGSLIYSAVIGDELTQENLAAVPFAKRKRDYYAFPDEKIASLQALADQCGSTAWFDKYMTFPPPGPQPVGEPVSQICYPYGEAMFSAVKRNICFDQNNINRQCPMMDDEVFGLFGGNFVPGSYLGKTLYFERPDVVKALHAPTSKRFTFCTRGVLVGAPDGWRNDESLPSAQHVLPQVIDATQRVIIIGGDLDGNIVAEGTLLAIQNMTWGGQLGLQSKPADTFFVQMLERQFVDLTFSIGYPPPAPFFGGQGPMGTYTKERGLVWVHQLQAGHSVPEGQPRASVMHLEWLLGHREGFGPNDQTAYTDGDTRPGARFD